MQPGEGRGQRVVDAGRKGHACRPGGPRRRPGQRVERQETTGQRAEAAVSPTRPATSCTASVIPLSSFNDDDGTATSTDADPTM